MYVLCLQHELECCVKYCEYDFIWLDFIDTSEHAEIGRAARLAERWNTPWLPIGRIKFFDEQVGHRFCWFYSEWKHWVVLQFSFEVVELGWVQCWYSTEFFLLYCRLGTVGGTTRMLFLQMKWVLARLFSQSPCLDFCRFEYDFVNLYIILFLQLS